VTASGAVGPVEGTEAPRARGWLTRMCGSWGWAALVLLVAVLLAHGWSLTDGLSLDDHWHYHSIPQAHWSFRDLLNATTLDAAQQVKLWWQEKPVRFVYARPVAVALLKITYALSGDKPIAAHAVNLALHYAAALLIYALCRRLTSQRRWALLGGLAFAIYPHTVYAAGWLAAQNIVLQTMLMLAALLVYMRASGLETGPLPHGRGFSPLPYGRGSDSGPLPHGRGSDLRVGLFAIVIVLWVLALFSRENAIMMPGIVVAFDLAYGGWRRVLARWPAYVVFAVIGLAFLIWRLKFFYEPMPEVYVQHGGRDGYVLWWIAKLFHYLCAALLPFSMTVGPSGRYHPFREVPAGTVESIVLALACIGLYVLATRRARGYWIWPLWILLAILPVTNVLATPHSGYLCGVGVAVGLAIACDCLARRPRRAWRRTAHVVAIFVVLGYAVSMKLGRLLWMGMVYAEQYTMLGLKAAPPPAETEHVFLINLPFSGIYAKRCLAEQEGPRIEHETFHVLTFAPFILSMDVPSEVTQTDAHSLTVAVEKSRYFTGLLGRFLIAGFRPPCPFVTGQTFDAGEFDVKILDADADGVRKLAFHFDKPLADPSYCFYLSSWEYGGVRLDFAASNLAPAPLPPPPAMAVDVHDAASALLDGHAASAGVILAGLTSTDPSVRETAAEVVNLHFELIADALAAPIRDDLATPELARANAAAIWTWWQQRVSDDELAQIFHDRHRVRRLRHRRDEIQRARQRTGEYWHTDLCMTGPPYPSLRADSAACDR